MTNNLQFVLVLLASAVLVVVVFRSLHLPPLFGYLIVGMLGGPHALGWVADSEGTRYLAEFGVVFLMFSIGLEFSLTKLASMRRTVFGLGGSQVLATAIVFAAIFYAVAGDWRAALAAGGAIAMSSTAIVIRLLAERQELESPHGREAFGVLLFQDLAVVPLLIFIPALAGSGAELARALAFAMVKAAVVLTLLLVFGQRLMRGWFYIVALRRSHELFILNVLLVTLGLAYVTELAGLSLALGAFVAGMLISETEYRHQVEEDIKPFREVLLGLFFVTVGMQLDFRVVADRLGLIAALFAAQVVLKFAVLAALSRLFGALPGTAMRTGLALAQAGEFGLVLLALAASAGIVAPALMQPLLASMLLTMFLAPFLIQWSNRIVMRVVRSEWMMQSLALHKLAVRTIESDRHVVILGYGRTGQALARMLESEGIGYVALDLDPDRVREADAAGERVVFGDAGRRETLVAAGLNRASAVVVTFADTHASLKVLHHVRQVNAHVPVLVRTLDDAEIERLGAAGATEVVPETLEASLMLGAHTLALIGVPVRRVLRRVSTVREARYGLLRGFFHGATDSPDDPDEASQPRLHSVLLERGAHAIGRTLGALDLQGCGAAVSAVRHQGRRIAEPEADLELVEGDVVVLRGDAAGVAAAELLLLSGR